MPENNVCCDKCLELVETTKEARRLLKNAEKLVQGVSFTSEKLASNTKEMLKCCERKKSKLMEVENINYGIGNRDLVHQEDVNHFKIQNKEAQSTEHTGQIEERYPSFELAKVLKENAAEFGSKYRFYKTGGNSLGGEIERTRDVSNNQRSPETEKSTDTSKRFSFLNTIKSLFAASAVPVLEISSSQTKEKAISTAQNGLDESNKIYSNEMKSDMLLETLQNTKDSLDDMQTCCSSSATMTYGLLEQVTTKMNELLSRSDTSNFEGSENKNNCDCIISDSHTNANAVTTAIETVPCECILHRFPSTCFLLGGMVMGTIIGYLSLNFCNYKQNATSINLLVHNDQVESKRK